MCFVGPDARELALFVWIGFMRRPAVLCGSTQAESSGARHEGATTVDSASGRGGGDRSQ